MKKQLECIMGVKKGQQFYLTENDSWSVCKLDAKTWDNHELAVLHWMMLTDCGISLPDNMERVFVPIYKQQEEEQ